MSSYAERMHNMEFTEAERETCRNLIEKNLCNVKGRDIAIWGTREKGMLAQIEAAELGLECKFFVSSRPKTNDCYGLPLCTPDVLDIQKHYVIVATMSLEVYRHLKKIGYRTAGQDCCFTAGRWQEDTLFCNCFVGRGTYGYETLSHDLSRFIKRIGRYCSISKYARIASNSPLEYVSTNPFLWSPAYAPQREKLLFKIEKNGMAAFCAPPTGDRLVEIGNDVWIGMNAIIMPGVKIGDGAIIGAGAVVTKDVEPYAILGGVPARFIRYRYPKEMVEAFLRIKWWDWPIEKIEDNLELFYQPELFCKTFDRR